MKRCTYCSKKFEATQLARHAANCTARKRRIADCLTQEYLAAAFAAGHSASAVTRQVKVEFDLTIDIGSLIDRAKRLGVKTPTIADSANLPAVRQQYEATCLEKYGKQNVSSVGKFKRKRTQTNRRKFGVANVFQNAEVKAKSRQTMLSRHGVEHPAHTARFAEARSQGQHSRHHVRLAKALTLAGFANDTEVPGLFCKYNRHLGRITSPIADIVLRDWPVVIEVYGDRWHANPKRYKPEDIIRTWTGPLMAADIWRRDRRRVAHIRSCGYTVLTVWESDVLNATQQAAFIRRLAKKLN